jgi:N6-L-threonylcarbamoyladenine synthase
VILGEAKHSQQDTHLKFGGIIPPVAQAFHRKHIKTIVDETLKRSNLSMNAIDAIAVTNRPGLQLSLLVGVRYAKHLARQFNKPIIPIHHMEAHALTARLSHKIEFPFLCLLISGGHSLLTLVKSVTEFELLGEHLDDAPGEAMDKVARRLKIHNLPEYANMSGGAAIEKAAKDVVVDRTYNFTLPLAGRRDCQFSFAGLKNSAQRAIKSDELDLGENAITT